jgi:hypothetical protein
MMLHLKLISFIILSIVKIILVSLCCAISFSTLSAQTISYSPYSYYGVGVLKERTSALNRSLSETGIGLRDPLNLNNLNPASYTSLQGATQITEAGMFYESSKLETTKLTRPGGSGNLTSLNLWFRFSKKWGGTIGLAPFSFVNYNIIQQREFIEGEFTDVNYTGKSGLTQVYFGHGFQVTKNLSLGANFCYIFGSLQKEETIIAGRSFGLNLKNRIYLNKANVDWGAQYSFKLKKSSVNIGATYGSKLKLNTSGEVKVYEAFGRDSLFTRSQNPTEYVLPSHLGLGVAFQSARSTIVFDYKIKNWEEAELEKGTKLQNTHRISAGYEYKGKPTSDRYIDGIALRTGFYAQNNYLVLNNKPFDEWGFTLGTGLPLNGNRGTLNLSYNFNSTGTKEKGLIQQQSTVFVIDVVFRDLWGIRRKFD